MGRREEAWKKLFLAATSGDVKRVRELVALGADVNQQGANGWTMLHTAAYQGHVEVASICSGGGGGRLRAGDARWINGPRAQPRVWARPRG